MVPVGNQTNSLVEASAATAAGAMWTVTSSELVLKTALNGTWRAEIDQKKR